MRSTSDLADDAEARRARQRETSRKWREANRERVRANHREWLAKNPGYKNRWRSAKAERVERDNQRSRKWRANNPDRVKTLHAEWYARNPFYHRGWRAANPEKYREHNRNSNLARKAKTHELHRQLIETGRERNQQLQLRFMANRLRKSVMTSGELPEHSIWECDLADLITHVGLNGFDETE